MAGGRDVFGGTIDLDQAGTATHYSYPILMDNKSIVSFQGNFSDADQDCVASFTIYGRNEPLDHERDQLVAADVTTGWHDTGLVMTGLSASNGTSGTIGASFALVGYRYIAISVTASAGEADVNLFCYTKRP